MPSGREEHQNDLGIDDPELREAYQDKLPGDKPELSASERKLLSVIFGESYLALEGIKSKGIVESFGNRGTAEPAALASILTTSRDLPVSVGATVALIQHWVRNHVPTTQIEEISIQATAVIGDRDKAVKWLSEPNTAMDNRAPIDFVGEKDGYERVKNLLLRIEYGALA
jgi:hypothetical protein